MTLLLHSNNIQTNYLTMQSPRYGRRHDLGDTSDHLERQDKTDT